MHLAEELTLSARIVNDDNTNFVSIEHVGEKLQGTNAMVLIFGFEGNYVQHLCF